MLTKCIFKQLFMKIMPSVDEKLEFSDLGDPGIIFDVTKFAHCFRKEKVSQSAPRTSSWTRTSTWWRKASTGPPSRKSWSTR